MNTFDLAHNAIMDLEVYKRISSRDANNLIKSLQTELTSSDVYAGHEPVTPQTRLITKAHFDAMNRAAEKEMR